MTKKTASKKTPAKQPEKTSFRKPPTAGPALSAEDRICPKCKTPDAETLLRTQRTWPRRVISRLLCGKCKNVFVRNRPY